MIARGLLITLALFGVNTLTQSIDRYPEELYEGDTCTLRDGGIGICRKTIECRKGNRMRELHCEFSGANPVICCALAANATFDASARVVDDACNTVQTVRNKIADHVVGIAEAANVGEFPFMALLTYPEERTRCGAALVSDRFLITAAHCFKNEKPLTARLGTNRADDPLPDIYEVSQVYSHRNYNRLSKQNDIAIVELKTSVKRNVNVQPICLHTSLVDLPESTNLTIMGWGQDNHEEFPNSLLKGIVRPVLRSRCQTAYDEAGYSLRLTENQLCSLGDKNAQNIATDTCQGDSGGPLVLRQNNKYYLVGLVSVGTGCGNPDVPGIYTRVSSYLDWITSQVWKN